ncbi:MAG: pyridoxamine 5'-phosphate oxidase family protein [Chloroflexi bacterium]|nr:pyridoxamine 5'-phosphate oxidase family protein [Chloroflexota bacterium]
MAQIPESHRDILEKRSFAHVATVNKEGKPQVSPVWVEYDGNYILLNSAKGRKKDRNITENPEKIAISIQDPDNPYRYVGIQRHVDQRGAVGNPVRLLQDVLSEGDRRDVDIGDGAAVDDHGLLLRSR